jgi:hypothetical protein
VRAVGSGRAAEEGRYGCDQGPRGQARVAKAQTAVEQERAERAEGQVKSLEAQVRGLFKGHQRT